MNGRGSGGNSAPSQKSSTPPEKSLERFLAVQERRIALELKQNELALRELDHNQKLADKSIDAQERDRRHAREDATLRQRRTQRFALLIVLLVFIFAGYCIHVGQTALVMDVVKVVVAFAGGMGFQAYRANRDKGNGGD